MEKLLNIYKKHKEIINYIIVGGLTTLVRWGTTVIFENLFAGFMSEGVLRDVLITALSLIITILFAFPPNKLVVFESKSFRKDIVGIEFIAFISARAAASLIELVGIPLLCEVTSMNITVATMVVSVVVLVVNYIFSKLFIFKNREEKKDKKAEKESVGARAKDKLIGSTLMVICGAVALVSISFWVVDTITKIF
ncbi:MAG: GtrA family protein [Ruminococcus sp.]|nr:GtrA family protein [Ruminococcus sp.]